MRSTLPNTDKPRIPHSEYHYTGAKLAYPRAYVTTKRDDVMHADIKRMAAIY